MRLHERLAEFPPGGAGAVPAGPTRGCYAGLKTRPRPRSPAHVFAHVSDALAELLSGPVPPRRHVVAARSLFAKVPELPRQRQRRRDGVPRRLDLVVPPVLQRALDRGSERRERHVRVIEQRSQRVQQRGEGFRGGAASGPLVRPQRREHAAPAKFGGTSLEIIVAARRWGHAQHGGQVRAALTARRREEGGQRVEQRGFGMKVWQLRRPGEARREFARATVGVPVVARGGVRVTPAGAAAADHPRHGPARGVLRLLAVRLVQDVEYRPQEVGSDGVRPCGDGLVDARREPARELRQRAHGIHTRVGHVAVRVLEPAADGGYHPRQMHERVLPLQGAHPVKQAEDLAPSARLGRGDELLAETRHDCGDVVGLPRVRGQPFELLHGHALGVPVPEPRQRLQRLVLKYRILARHVGGCFRATIRTFVDADVSSRVRVFDGAPPTTAEVRQPPRVVSQGRLGGRKCLNWLPK